MADTTSSHDLPYPEGADDAVPHSDIKNLAEKLDTELDDIAPSQITGAAAGQLLIANASGVVTATAVTGDITISNAGVAEIGAKKVTNPELGDKAVNTRTLDDGAVTRPKVASWIQTGSVSVSGTSGTATITWPTAFSGSGYAATIAAVGNGIVTINPRLGIHSQSAGSITVSWAEAPSSMTIRAIAISG